MAELSEQQVALISAYIKQHGVAQDQLHEDLLDHVCTSIENRIEQGESFEEAFQYTLKLFGPGGLKQVQQETFELLTEINATMKKVTFGFGLTSTILLLAGTIFKLMHWPGAGIMIFSGACLLVLIYFPTILYHKLKEAPKNETALHVTGFLGISMLTVGTLFKIMHWPGASVILVSALAFMAFGYIPVYFYKKYKTSVNKPITLSASLVAMTCLILVFALTRMNVNDYDHGLCSVQQGLVESTDLASNNAALYAKLDNNPETRKLKKSADDAISFLEEFRIAVIMTTEGLSTEEAKSLPLNHLKRNRDYGVVKEMLFGEDNTSEFHNQNVVLQLEKYKTELLGVYTGSMREDMALLFPYDTKKSYDFQGNDWNWAQYYFYDIPASGIVSQIAKLKSDIRQTENQALIYLISRPKASDPPS